MCKIFLNNLNNETRAYFTFTCIFKEHLFYTFCILGPLLNRCTTPWKMSTIALLTLWIYILSDSTNMLEWDLITCFLSVTKYFHIVVVKYALIQPVWSQHGEFVSTSALLLCLILKDNTAGQVWMLYCSPQSQIHLSLMIHTHRLCATGSLSGLV